MATALAAVRVQPDGLDVVHRYMEVVHGMRDVGASSRVRVRAFAAFGKSDSRGSVCRVPLLRTFYPRREALVSAMGEGEHDITDMQEADKVSGEWWKNALTAVQDWSSEKLLGLAELADGSLFFSFGGSDTARPAAKTSRAQTESKATRSTHNTTPVTRPPRQPSSFRKHSPIPASRKKSATVSEDAPATVSEEAPAAGQEDKKTQKAKSHSKSARPQRPPSAFSKRSPIPKDRDSVPASTSKKKTPEVAPELPPELPPAAETPTPAVTSRKKAPEVAPEVPPAAETPTPAVTSRKKAPEVAPEVPPAAEAPTSAVTSKKKAPEVAPEVPPAAETPTPAFDSQKDSPFSPELKEILNHGNETQSEDTVKSKTDAKSSSPAPAKKKPSKPATEESEVAQNGAVTEDLGSYKLPELRSLAKARGLKGYSKLKKGELVELLASSQP